MAETEVGSEISVPHDLLHSFLCADCCEYNGELARLILLQETSSDTVRTHLFKGRYENIYIKANKLPHLSNLLDKALQEASKLLGVDQASLKIGFWFNIMRQGDVTLKHSHDDYDELLSGTYYIVVPNPAAKLILDFKPEKKIITPREGMFVFFHPSMPHEVSQNNSEHPRISIGFNIGLKNTD